MPRSRGGTDADENLALSCQGCNNRKFTAIVAIDPLNGEEAPLYDPRTDDWLKHFAWSDDYLLVEGVTPVGRATVARMQLNRDAIVNLRRLLRRAGEHPLVGSLMARAFRDPEPGVYTV